jgi:hypothetical protein
MLKTSSPLIFPISGHFDDTSIVLALEDNPAPVRITQYRALHVNLRTAAGVEIGTGGSPIPVSLGASDVKIGRVSITDAGGTDQAVVGPASNWSGSGGAVASIDPSGSTKLYVASLAHQLWPATGNRAGVSGDGTYYGQLMNDLGDLVVSLGSVTTGAGSTQIVVGDGVTGNGSPRVTIAGQVANDGVDIGSPIKIGGRASTATPTAVSADGDRVNAWYDRNGRAHIYSDQTLVVGGNVAHDAADSGNPIKFGGKARQTNPTAVADGDRVDAMLDDVGRFVPVDQNVRDNIADAEQSYTTTTEAAVLSAAGSGVFLDLKEILITNTSASNVTVSIRDATTGTIRRRFRCPANETRGIVFSTPLRQTTANNPWTAQLSDALSTVYVAMTALKNV